MTPRRAQIRTKPPLTHRIWLTAAEQGLDWR